MVVDEGYMHTVERGIIRRASSQDLVRLFVSALLYFSEGYAFALYCSLCADNTFACMYAVSHRALSGVVSAHQSNA